MAYEVESVFVVVLDGERDEQRPLGVGGDSRIAESGSRGELVLASWTPLEIATAFGGSGMTATRAVERYHSPAFGETVCQVVGVFVPQALNQSRALCPSFLADCFYFLGSSRHRPQGVRCVCTRVELFL